MTEKEKIKSILEDHAKNNNNDYHNLISMIADDIIKAFPQITKKPVGIVLGSKNASLNYSDLWSLNDLETRQEWIDSHYVEVV